MAGIRILTCPATLKTLSHSVTQSLSHKKPHEVRQLHAVFLILPTTNYQQAASSKQDHAYFGIGNTIRASSTNEASAALPLILY